MAGISVFTHTVSGIYKTRLSIGAIREHAPQIFSEKGIKDLFVCESCGAAFFRGAFLCSGFVNPPEKPARLELAALDADLACDAAAALTSHFRLPKLSVRRGKQILYYRDAESVEYSAQLGSTASTEKLFDDYLQFGGLPQRFLLNDAASVRAYIDDVFATIVIKDVVARNKISDVDLLWRLTAFLLDNVGNTFSANAICNKLKSEGIRTTVPTLMNYIGAIKDAMVVQAAPRYDLKGKALLSTSEKYYATDLGLRNNVKSSDIVDYNKLYENVVYIEMLSRGYEINVGRIGEYEVDFICVKGRDKIYIQVAYLLADMERDGFGVDADGLRAFGSRLESAINEAERGIYLAAGESFNINSPKQLGAVLFDKLKLPHYKKTKQGYSTGADVLEKLRDRHPIIDMILYYRQLSKLKSTYADGLLKVIDPSDGRIHTTFRQTLTQTGRLSSVEPNLQNIPVRSGLGKTFRRFFVAAEGKTLVDADYSQIELRILAHMSGDETLIDAFCSGADIHTITASQVFGVPPELVSGEMRKRAKAVNFGIIYGIGDYSLSEDIGVSMREAKEYIESYFAKYPKIKEYMDGVKAQAKRDGYVTTIFGRRRYIPELSSGKKPTVAFGERVAMNTPIQGSAADIIKKAMIDVAAALREAGLAGRLILQIHDELIVESPAEEAARAAGILKECMESAVKLKVPLVADTHTGHSWYDAKGGE